MPDSVSFLTTKTRTIALLIGLFSLIFSKTFAYDPGEDSLKKKTEVAAAHEKKGFDAGKLITEHIGQCRGHRWHEFGNVNRRRHVEHHAGDDRQHDRGLGGERHRDG